jgi:hypothetical protein
VPRRSRARTLCATGLLEARDADIQEVNYLLARSHDLDVVVVCVGDRSDPRHLASFDTESEGQRQGIGCPRRPAENNLEIAQVVSRLKLSEKPHSFDIGGRAGALVALKLLVAGEETLQVFGDTRPRPVLQLQDDVLGSSGIGIGRGFVEQDIGRCVSVDAAFRPAPGKFDSRQALENGAG